jgi:hypothetical protein
MESAKTEADEFYQSSARRTDQSRPSTPRRG